MKRTDNRARRGLAKGSIAGTIVTGSLAAGAELRSEVLFMNSDCPRSHRTLLAARRDVVFICHMEINVRPGMLPSTLMSDAMTRD